MKLESDFYLRTDVFQIAKELLGKVLFTKVRNELTAGIITETEAYDGIIDKASHAFGGRRTKRNEIMYANGGTGYVYKCYGIHDLFNVVTNEAEIPHAVLIRAVYPLAGLRTILKRRNMVAFTKNTSGGPGTVSKALGISIIHNGISLSGKSIWIEDCKLDIPESVIKISKRIGVEGAGEAAHYPYRYYLSWESSVNLFQKHTESHTK